LPYWLESDIYNKVIIFIIMFMKKIFLCLCVLILSVGCSPITSHHGLYNMNAIRSWVEKNTVLKHELQSRFGPASFIDKQDDLTSYYYVAFTKERFAFFKPEITQRNILAIHFKNDSYYDYAEYKLEDGKDIQIVSDVTPIYGKEMSVIQQIFSNVGRFNSMPGAGGGRADGSVLGRIPGGI